VRRRRGGWGRGRRGTGPDALLALLVLVPTLSIAQWMLGSAGWYDSHDGYSTAMFYVPWQLNLLGPAYYLYFRSLTSQEFRLRGRAWLHLASGLGKLTLLGAALANYRRYTCYLDDNFSDP